MKIALFAVLLATSGISLQSAQAGQSSVSCRKISNVTRTSNGEAAIASVGTPATNAAPATVQKN